MSRGFLIRMRRESNKKDQGFLSAKTFKLRKID